MASRVEALVKPELLIWARQSSGLNIAEVAKKAQIKEERLISWEKGESKPSIAQLRKLGKIYKRPLAVFYLSEPPKTFEAMHDFRIFSEKEAIKESSQLRLEIRRARYRRQIALELYEITEGTLPKFNLSINRSEDPEELGKKLRKIIGVPFEQQFEWRTAYEAFNNWRNYLENLGIIVFQATEVTLSEMRGFSIGDTPLPVIVVNIKDSPYGRIFTMLHEFIHILLNESGICDLEEDEFYISENRKIEIFCNRIAGAILIPLDNLLNDNTVVLNRQNIEWKEEDIYKLAKKYGTSRETVLRRLLVAGRTSKEFYQRKREEYRKDFEIYHGLLKQRKGFAPTHIKVVSREGLPFIRLVLSSFYQKKITASDLSDYLEVRLKHIPKIEKAVSFKFL
jgi:Zn-dependent peptidase ImmA (M78 family)/DNA-binding XRE family transcriptional regulator